VTKQRDFRNHGPKEGAITPEWTTLNLVIQAIDILGAHLAALVAHEYRFGFIGHSLVGLIASVLSGCFLQRIIVMTVYGTGDAMPLTVLEAGIYQTVAGLALGGMAMLAVGLLRDEMTKTSSK
jgi:hypothetical protein